MNPTQTAPPTGVQAGGGGITPNLLAQQETPVPKQSKTLTLEATALGIVYIAVCFGGVTLILALLYLDICLLQQIVACLTL